MPNSNIEDVFNSLLELASNASPAVKLVGVVASSILEQLNDTSDDDLKIVSGFERICAALDAVASGSLDISHLPAITNELREISKSLKKFVELIS